VSTTKQNPSDQSPIYIYQSQHSLDGKAADLVLTTTNPQLINASTCDYLMPFRSQQTTNSLMVPSRPLLNNEQTPNKTTLNRSTLSLNLTPSYKRMSGQFEVDLECLQQNNCQESLNSEFILEELKESPKSVYSRYFANCNKKNKSQLEPQESQIISPLLVIDIDESPKTHRLNYLVYSKQHQDKYNRIQHIDSSRERETSLSDSKSFTHSCDSYEKMATNEQTSSTTNNSVTSLKDTTNLMQLTKILLAKKNSTGSASLPKRIRKPTRKKSSISSSQYDNQSKRSSASRIHSSPTRFKCSAGSISTNKLRLVSLNKNKVSSDVDIEEDLIFNNNDDNDSLSSAGLACSPSHTLTAGCSQHTLLLLNNKNTNCTHRKKSNSDNDKSYLTLNYLSNLSNSDLVIKTSASADISTQNSSKQKQQQTQQKQTVRLVNVNSLSISDMDPDENILNNLLVKQTSTSEKK